MIFVCVLRLMLRLHLHTNRLLKRLRIDVKQGVYISRQKRYETITILNRLHVTATIPGVPHL